MKYSKYHALGNDYIVIDPKDIPNGQLDSDQIVRVCHRNYGIGSDGLLLGPLPSTECDFGLRIFNPDGGEAEKSGNGLRIFSRFLWDNKQVGEDPFSVFTIGGHVISQVSKNGRTVKVEMGKAEFISNKIPVSGPSREVLNEKTIIDDEEIEINAVSVGNPHCIILDNTLSLERVKTLGPKIENHSLFPNRVNVQFMKILDKQNIQIEIWERGAGYTLASGSSSSASAAMAFKLGYCDSNIYVHLPGGIIDINISNDFFITMTGGVTKVADGDISDEVFSS
ncbi:diaminopimelate epimerase [Thermodesulfobacteriota bacterium]